MADNRTMEELLQAPTEGNGEAIVVLEINADHFEIKTNLLQLVQANPYHGFKRENPHTHINNFKRITSTLKFRDVPNDVIKLMMFSYSLEGNARVWYDKEPLNSILTWKDLAWERFKEMLKACPHHGFMELAQIDTFYNGLNDNDQDSLNAAAGGNLLSKTTREALQIIKNKSKVRYSRNKPNVSMMNTTSRENACKTDDRIDKLVDQISTLVDIFAKKVITPARIKAVEESCVTCGGAHAYYNCPNTDSNQPSVCTTTVEQDIKEAMDKEQTNFQGGTAHIQPLVTPIPEPYVSKTLPKPNIPYPSRLSDQKLREKATNQMEKFFQIFQDLHFDISFVDALLLMPKFSSTIKSLLTNKDKLFELAKIPLNENFLAMLLKKLLKKLGDPGKLLIPCDFLGMDTMRYSSTYDDLTVNRIDIIDVAREEYALEMLDFSNNSSGGNPTLTFEPILSDTSFSLIPFEGSDFILEEIDAYLKDDSISPKIDHVDCAPEGDICLIEKLLNDDSFQLPPMDLKQGEVVKAKSLIEEPSELELKELPSHLEYAYLEVIDKLPKITDIKGIEPRFYTHKILMEDNYKPAVQSQRRVNPKIHKVIKKEVIKLLDAGMIYPISDSPWVSPIHCVPKKGGIIVVENENNELIPTRLVTGWRVYIDYRKLNDATRKDHFPLPFMDQMLERLAGNEFYCFLDGFSGYFQIPINPPDQERPLSPVPMEHLLIAKCPLAFAMLLGHFISV
uniref:Reverse transcriptase domain-containing protein n=1 Tax=Tanacetum cinerariifolium TaxID=118510 RepID=A0A699HWV3_TANCI|nr:reverse transcriptase domain-containing protein [Tanacetum cinerariifolium]